MSLKSMIINLKTKKLEKKLKKKEQEIEALKKQNEVRMKLSEKQNSLNIDSNTAKFVSKSLDEDELQQKVLNAKMELYVQKDKLIKRVKNANAEYQDLLKRPDGSVKEKELKRCEGISKNSIYALGLVIQALDKLENFPSELEWHHIIQDLTNGYKIINAISYGSDLLNRFAFWFQKARFGLKNKVSIDAMEKYFGKNIDDLLASQNLDEVREDLMVKNDAMNLITAEEIAEAVKWGTVYNIHPVELTAILTEQSLAAEKNGSTPVINNPNEEGSVKEYDFDDVLNNMHTPF